MAVITELHESLILSVLRPIAPLRLPVNQKVALDLSFDYTTPPPKAATRSPIVRNIRPTTNSRDLPQSSTVQLDSGPLASRFFDDSLTPSILGGLDLFPQPLASTSTDSLEQ